MQKIADNRYTRKGFSLLWSFAGLAAVSCNSRDVLTLRQFLRFVDALSEDMPGGLGTGAVIVGVEGALDVLSSEDAESWLTDVLKPAVLKFQEYYEGERALILWVATGRGRITADTASGDYYWNLTKPSGATVEIGRILWGGAGDGLYRIVNSSNPTADPDGSDWIGLHHTRIS